MQLENLLSPKEKAVYQLYEKGKMNVEILKELVFNDIKQVEQALVRIEHKKKKIKER